MPLPKPSKFKLIVATATILVAAFVAAFVVSFPAEATQTRGPLIEVYQGQVIRVADGDSITVRTGETNIPVRLAEIDAPERGQPYGNNARVALASMVAGKTISVSVQGRDRYGRTIAYVESEGVNVNREMIARGAAWAYRDYLRDRSLIGLETNAQRNRTGLWAMPEHERIAPWEYRANQRRKQDPTTAR